MRIGVKMGMLFSWGVLLAVAVMPVSVAVAAEHGGGTVEHGGQTVKQPVVMADDAAMVKMDIVDTAVAAGQFTTLATALQAAGLVAALKGAGPFTVFAPTDAAFAKLPVGTLDALLKDPAKLKDILLYHVVSGKVMAQDVVALNSATTLEGKAVKITVEGSNVRVNDANIAKTDVEASNGVIHVIDTVLIPQGQ